MVRPNAGAQRSDSMPLSEKARKIDPNLRLGNERVVDITGMLLAAAAATLVVLHSYCVFLDESRLLWNSLIHDRNAHYEFPAALVLAMRHVQPIRFFTVLLLGSKLWPPLHGLLTALLLLAGGPNYRVAVITSVLGWWLTAMFAFLTARRISQAGGNAAGLIAAALVLASPALREYGTDIMLESLGAGLTMAALYFYAVAQQEESIGSWRGLAIVLTLLFFEKYNYWLLVALSLTLEQFLLQRAKILATIKQALEHIDRNLFVEEAMRPLGWLALAIVVLLSAVWVRGPYRLKLGHFSIRIYPPDNLITALYTVILLRLALAWRNKFHDRTPRVELVRWHIVACAVSLMIPGRLSMFLGYLGPTNYQETHSIAWALALYFSVAMDELHANRWISVVVAAALIVAMIRWRSWRAGGTALLLYIVISTLAVCLHPNQKDRYMYSWFPAVWVAAALGAMGAIYRIGRAPRYRVATILSWSVALAAFTILLDYALAAPPAPGQLSNLEISDAYLPALAGSKRVVFLSNLQIQSFVQWTYLERYRRLGVVEWPLKGSDATPEVAARYFSELAASHDSDEAIVFVDVPPRSPDYVPLSDYAPWAAMLRATRANPHLQIAGTWDVLYHDVEVTLWKAAPEPK